MSGVHHPVPHQLLGASGSRPTPQLPRIFIWHKVMDAICRRNMKPFLYSYELPPGMSYAEAGRLKLQRLVNICRKRFGMIIGFEGLTSETHSVVSMDFSLGGKSLTSLVLLRYVVVSSRGSTSWILNKLSCLNLIWRTSTTS